MLERRIPVRFVHLVGSIGLESTQTVFATVGKLIGGNVKRCPDGEPGGRRMWISWQYPFLRSSPYLIVDESQLLPGGVGFCALRIADGVKPAEITFGELGYAREARTSYQDFLAARQRGLLPPTVRFQVSLPTPLAVIAPFLVRQDFVTVEPAYEKAMLREVQRICEAIPNEDLAIQWDACLEMLAYDGQAPSILALPDLERGFAERFNRLTEGIPHDVQLGFHLCYGDLDAKHAIEPKDLAKAAGFANLLLANVPRPINWIHMPVPISRNDEAYFAPLRDLKRGPETDLYLGLVHLKDGAEGAMSRMAAAKAAVSDFGIATECGMARKKTPQMVEQLLEIHRVAANAE